MLTKSFLPSDLQALLLLKETKETLGVTEG